MIRFLMGTARMQSYLILIAGGLFIGPTLYEKYQENPEKATRLVIYSPIALAFLIAPIVMYRRASRRMLTAIDFHHPSNTFRLETYRKERLSVLPQYLTIRNNPAKPRIVHELEIQIEDNNSRVFKVEGYGDW
jgi:hypothetical protein